MHPRTPLRAMAGLVATALVGAPVALVAPAAHAAPPPDADIAGIAHGPGAPVAGVEVGIYDVEADGSVDYLGYTTTDATGEYWFDLDVSGAAGANDGWLYQASDRPQVKLAYYDFRTLTGDQLRGKYEWYNDQPSANRATAVTKGTSGTTTTVPTVTLAPQAGIKGTVSVPVPAGYYYEGEVTAYDADDDYEDEADFDSDPATTGRGNELTYLLDNLDPNQSYTLRYSAWAYPISGVGEPINYVGKFYKTGSTFATATPVAVGAGGTITQPIDIALTNVLSADESPSIVGQVAPGKTLSVDPGTWSIRADNEYTYQWLLDDTQVGTAPTYTLGKGDLGKKLRVVVTTRVRDYIGSASTESTKVKYASKLKAKARKTVVKSKTVVQIVGKVQVKGVKKAKAAKARSGRVTVYEGDVKVGKGKVVRGVVRVILKGVTAGKHEFTVVFSGKKAADATSVEKIKV